MTQSLLTPSVIAKEALFQLENNLVMANNVHRQYKEEFVKVGNTVTIRKPVKFLATDGATLVKQDVEEGNTSIVINKRKHVGWAFNTQDLTLTIKEYSKRYIEPAAIALANQIDVDGLALYKKVWNWAGTPGQTVNSYADFSKGPKRLDKQAVPKSMRKAVLGPDDHWDLAGSQTGLFFNSIGEKAYRAGSIGRIGNVDTFMDQNLATHTVGTADATNALVRSVSNGTVNPLGYTTYAASKATGYMDLGTDGWDATKTILTGDVITIADVYAVNPLSKVSTGELMQFTVVSDVTSNGTTSNETIVRIAPAIIVSGPYQNVNSIPADNAQITRVGTKATQYPQNLVFHENAFALVTVPLAMPDGVAFKARESHDGISIRLVKDYDIVNDEDVVRLDVLYGWEAIYPDLATRLSGTA
jgi:hypothetical protein